MTCSLHFQWKNQEVSWHCSNYKALFSICFYIGPVHCTCMKEPRGKLVLFKVQSFGFSRLCCLYSITLLEEVLFLSFYISSTRWRNRSHDQVTHLLLTNQPTNVFAKWLPKYTYTDAGNFATGVSTRAIGPHIIWYRRASESCSAESKC